MMQIFYLILCGINILSASVPPFDVFSMFSAFLAIVCLYMAIQQS